MTNDWKLVWCTAEFLIVNFLETFAFTVALSPAHHYRAKVNKPWNQTVDGLQLSIIKQRTELSDMTKISPFLILDNRIINQKRAYHIFCALGHILYCGGPLNWCDLMTSSNRLRLNLWFPLFKSLRVLILKKFSWFLVWLAHLKKVSSHVTSSLTQVLKIVVVLLLFAIETSKRSLRSRIAVTFCSWLLHSTVLKIDTCFSDSLDGSSECVFHHWQSRLKSNFLLFFFPPPLWFI